MTHPLPTSTFFPSHFVWLGHQRARHPDLPRFGFAALHKSVEVGRLAQVESAHEKVVRGTWRPPTMFTPPDTEYRKSKRREAPLIGFSPPAGRRRAGIGAPDDFCHTHHREEPTKEDSGTGGLTLAAVTAFRVTHPMGRAGPRMLENVR